MRMYRAATWLTLTIFTWMNTTKPCSKMTCVIRWLWTGAYIHNGVTIFAWSNVTSYHRGRAVDLEKVPSIGAVSRLNNSSAEYTL